MRTALAALLGCALALAYSSVLGFFTLRADAFEAGAILRFSNEIEGVLPAQPGYWQRLAVILLSGLVTWLALAVSRMLSLADSKVNILLVAFSIALTLIVVWALATTELPYNLATSSREMPLLGWLRSAGLSMALPAVAGVVIFLGLSMRGADPATPAEATQEDDAQESAG